MRTYLFLGVLLCGLFSKSISAKPKPFFDNEIIRMVDGLKIGPTTIGLGGRDINDMLWLINEIRVMQNGYTNKQTGKTTKHYAFQDELYSVTELAMIEQEFYRDAIAHSQEELIELQDTLDHAKEDFMEKTKIFVQTMRLMKSLIVQLIEEWCEKRGRTDSILLNWSKVEEDEHEHFRQNVTTLVELDLFLHDLKQFLTDLANSCPKAVKDFLKNREHYADLANKAKEHHKESKDY